MFPPPAATGTPGQVAIVHEDSQRAQQLARLLHGTGHRVSLAGVGRDVVQAIVDCSPDVVLVSHSLPDLAAVVRDVRRALAEDVRILVFYGSSPEGTPPEADDVQCAEPLHRAELQIRVTRLVREVGVQRALRKKTSELLGLYKMSWTFSLAGGAEGLFGQVTRHTAEMLRAERGLLLLYDPKRARACRAGARLRRDS